MNCRSCGASMRKNEKFCKNCGASVTVDPIVSTENASSSSDLSQNTETTLLVSENLSKVNAKSTPTPSSKPQKGKNRNRKKKITILIAVAATLLILISIGVILILNMMPLEIDVSKPDETTTKTGTFSELEFEIESNQSVRSVSYALNPKKKSNTDLYTKIDDIDKGKNITVSLENLKIPVGQSSLYLYIETTFGEYFHKVNLNFDLGYLAAPNPDFIVTLSDGLEVAGGELLVIAKDNFSENMAKELFNEYNGEVIGQIYFLNQYQVYFEGISSYELEQIKTALESNENISSVCYNAIIENVTSAYPNDSEYDNWDTTTPAGNNWGLECIDAPGAWEYNNLMSTVKVGVIDSCLDYDHPDLQVNPQNSSFLATDDFKTLDELMDYYNDNLSTHTCSLWDALRGKTCYFCGQKDHGTHVSGIIGARANNNKGVSGVNWNAEICFGTGWYYNVTGDNKLLTTSSVEALIYQIIYLALNDCRVINLSLGSTDPSEITAEEIETSVFFENTLKKLEDSGYDFLIVKSAGNEEQDSSDFYLNRVMTYGESAKAHVLLVAAVEQVKSNNSENASLQYGFADYSNYGSLVQIAAPGTNIYSTVMNGYDYMDGTSMASPMVSGVASLLYSLDENLTYDQVKDILINSADNNCAKEGTLYPILNARLAVESYLNNGTETPDREEPSAGFITGLIQDAETEELIEEAVVILINTATEEKIIASVSEGTYYTWAVPGVYNMEFYSDGYLSETIYQIEVTEGVVNYNILLNMVENNDISGFVSGKIIDAFDASYIPNATLSVYAGINNTNGELVTSSTADSYGQYYFELKPGNYTICVSADGYTSGSTNVIVVSDEERSNQNCSLTPILENGEIRIVLTWNEYPSDLDSHLVGPSISGEKFHVFYKEKNHIYNDNKYVNLDVDDISSYGPETTSVYIPVSGSYTFYVHDFSNKSLTVSNNLATSGAKVTVYLAGKATPYVFNVPNKAGTLWEVFTISNGILTPTNEVTYQHNEDAIGQ